jgi:carbamoyl-phosphate synthase large subunit
MTIRVMITGAGSGLGQGIAKSLALTNLPIEIVFADIDAMNPGFYRGHEAIVIPKVEDSGALPRIIDLLRQNRIDVVLIGSVFDLLFFSSYRSEIEQATGSVVVVSPPDVIRMGSDKWLTVEFLRQAGLPHPMSHLPSSRDEALAVANAWGYPLVVKSRHGRASREVHVVRSSAQLSGVFESLSAPMLQKLIAEPRSHLAAEYTCSFVKTHDGRVLGPSIARRSLRDGHSWVVEVDVFAEVRPLVTTIAECLPVIGPFNVQLMVGPDGPAPFEFNPRFSGSTSIRAHFGFNEAELTVRSYFMKERLNSPQTRRGMAFRYHEEVFIDDVSASTLSAPFPKGTVHSWF